MVWSESRPFRAAFASMLGNIAALDVDGTDTLRVALFNNSITPDRDATAANSAFNAGQWANTNEVSQSGQWAAGGVALANPTLTTPSTGIVMLDGDDTASGSAATLSSYGSQLYDDTISTPVADQGIAYHYFGGLQAVTAGLFTIQWASTGLLRVTV